MPQRRPVSLVALAAALAGCATLPFSRVRTPAVPGHATPVGVVTEGGAFARPGLADRVRRTTETTTRRRVVPLDASTAFTDARLQDLVVRLGHHAPGLKRYDWREPRCTADRVALLAAEAHVGAVYRVRLEWTESEGPATEADVSALPPVRRTLVRAMQLVRPAAARDTTLTGRVTLVGFGATRNPPPVAVSVHLRAVGPRVLAPALDVDAAVGAAIRALPVGDDPEWTTFAARLASTGCPLLALGVNDTWLGRTPRERRVRTAALAAIGRPPVIVRNNRPAATPTPSPDERWSCSFLCAKHMVELCNRDKVLWDYYRTKWEETPCGTARPEPFLAECYRQQWMNGTYEASCMAPCEATVEGRERLIRILGEAGCLGRSS